MKTASMVLGIIGGSLAIIIALCMIFLGPMLSSLSSLDNFNNFTQNGITFSFDRLIEIYKVLGIPACLGGVLGLIGGIIVKKNNTAGGVLMIIGTVFCGLNLLLLVGAILAFIREKQPAVQYAPYPPYPNAPYPPQNPGYTYQQPYQQNPAYPGKQQNQPPYPSQDKPKDKEQQ